MKRMMTRFLMLGMVLTMLLGCKKDIIVEFDMIYDSVFIIPSGTAINTPINTTIPDIITNAQSTFATNETENDNIRQISLTSLELEITSSAGQEFDFLEDIELFISADGLDEVLLGYKFNMENFVDNTITLTCSQGDLQEYLKQSKFTVRARTTSDELLSDDVEISIKSVFAATALQNK